MKKKTKSRTAIRSFLLIVAALLISSAAFAQQTKVTGKVVDEQNEPVVGATVQVEGTTNGTATNVDGQFTLEVNSGARLRFSYVGFKTLTIKAANGMKVTMQEDANTLNEVVTIGYGSVKRKDVTTAVSSVSTKDLEKRPIVSALQGMQGMAAGLQISQANGQPGASPTIRVRGTTSLNGSNSPLYVVDGVPVDNVDYLSSDDIDNIQILKDASSAAIYGSRAANGVVIINTKQGKAGVTKIALNAHYAFNGVRDNQNSLNAAQYKELMDELGVVRLPNNLVDQTDWKKEVYRVGNVQDYQLNITSGNDKLRYFLSGGYTGEDGVIRASNYKRYNVRGNIINDISKWLTINADVAYSDYTYRGTGIISGTGSNRGGVLASVIETPTYGPVWDPANPRQYYSNYYGVNVHSPLENIARTKDNKSQYNKLLASGKAIVTLLPTLKFTSTLAFDRSSGITTNFLDPTETLEGRNQHGTGYDSRSTGTIWTFDNTINWKKEFGRHSLDMMAGSSWTNSRWSQSSISGSYYADADIKTLNAANKISWTGTGSTASEWAILSFFGRLQYNYNDTYLFTANLRADGSSKLAPGHRWGYFPSFSAAWRISQEKFMKNVSWIDDLKLRGGWGQTGNQSGLGDYSYLALYKINRIQWFGTSGDANAVPTRTKSILSNPELTWETTSQTNIGLDLTLLNNRLTFYVDYYYKLTHDLLMNMTLPTGGAEANTMVFNGGEIENRGWELAVSSKNLTGKLSWNTDFNISFNRNKLKSLKLTKVYPAAITTDHVHDYVVRNTPGRPLGSFYGYIADGVNRETGELNYRDVNNDGIISANDRTYIGDPNPDFTFGMTNTFAWKGLSLSVLLQGSYGNDIYNVSRMDNEGMFDGRNQSTTVLRRWRIPGQITDVPKAGFDQRNSTYYIEDGSYLRVKSITLSYDVPALALRKMHLTRLMPYISFTNLLTWTGYKGRDPEVNQYGDSGTVQGLDWGTYPLSRSFVMGLKVEF
ncbi:MAG: TonB-dependent receptor [Prevotellaceae bacterium]|nr:TonB-dependent receptor [Prevotellaceae bacterium]